MATKRQPFDLSVYVEAYIVRYTRDFAFLCLEKRIWSIKSLYNINNRMIDLSFWISFLILEPYRGTEEYVAAFSVTNDIYLDV